MTAADGPGPAVAHGGAAPPCATARAARALADRAAALAWARPPGARWSGAPPPRADLSAWLPGVADQAERPLCTAAVVAGFAGYAERRRGRARTPSLLFNYRTSRRYSGSPDRWGSTTLHALRAWSEYGLVEEEHWPFDPDRLDTDPPAGCFERAREWRQPHYGRLDRCPGPCPAYLDAIRTALALGLPVSLEIPLHPSILLSFGTGDVVPPGPGEPLVARHAVLLSGYDDTARPAGAAGEGALRFQNSWGPGWGDLGYGRIPYALVREGLVKDSWIVPGVPGALPEEPEKASVHAASGGERE
ncbi:C1 family peptidase [Nocardiopsis potens]|uniref:C1 family peptidase n=1 Tax=Nocardiopsis potens TaxID=1246458 RepID=UPI00034C28C1|nr:C1 family peptidase [Nocardiopsis potens]